MGQQSGLIVPGNIDLSNRPRVPNQDGSISTVRSLGVNIDGREVLIPTVVGGRVVSDDEAIREYKRTGKHLGIFSSPEASTAFGQRLHESEASKLSSPMPTQTYSITAPNGKTLDVTGDHVPTESELKDIFAKAGVDAAPDFRTQNEEPSAAMRAASQLYEKSPAKPVVDLLGGAANAVGLTGNGFHPLDALWNLATTVPKDIAKSHWDQAVTAAQKAKAAARAASSGDSREAALSATEAFGHGLAAILPILGPAAADVGEHGARGDLAGMAGGAAGLLVPFAAKYGLERRASANPAKADLLRREAEQQVSERVLAPGNPRYKGTAAAIAPQILDRKLSGGRLELQQLADEGMDAAGQKIDAAINSSGGRQAPIPTKPILDAMSKRIDELSTTHSGTGQVTPIPTAVGRVQNLTKLRDYIKQFGPDIPFDQLQKIRDDFYNEAAKRGGYERAGNVYLADGAWAAREGGSAIREALSQAMPETTPHYAEYSFWKNLDAVLDPSMGRPNSGTVTTGVTGGMHTTGAIIGAGLSHVPGLQAAGALVVSKLLPAIREAQASPAWQLASASKKAQIARAIQAGDLGVAKGMLLKIAEASPRTLDAVPAMGTATDAGTTPTRARR